MNSNAENQNIIAPEISVIIPVYNTEKYLKRCLDSITAQTFGNIEVICIDDGSTDNSLEILNKYASQDKRIIVLNQENLKQGAARNKGINIAKGKYITFVDADDWIEKDYCELLYNSAEQNNTNMAAASMVRDKKNKQKPHLKLNESKVINGANEIVSALNNHLETAGKLYKSEKIKDLRFIEGRLYEDAPYTIRAINQCGSMVTVPDAIYHYVSNPKSTIKQKCNIKNENDKIATNLDLLEYAESNNIDLGNWPIIKKGNWLYRTKYYKTHEDFYLFGIKLFSKNKPYNNKKNIFVFNTAFLGDVLLCNSLCQNIKNIFPESEITFICDNKWKDVALYQEGVDNVISYNKKANFFELVKFIFDLRKNFNSIFASIIVYRNERNYLIGKLSGSRFVLMPTKTRNKNLPVQERHNELISSLTNVKIQNYPIKYNLPETIQNPIENINQEYITLCCISKKPSKDMPVDIACELIENINNKTNYKVVLIGNGDLCSNFAQELEKKCDFINMVNKTTIPELAKVLKDSKCLISVDTGTMHLGYSLSVPTVCVFFEKGMSDIWAPKETMYKVKVITENQTADNIYRQMEILSGL